MLGSLLNLRSLGASPREHLVRLAEQGADRLLAQELAPQRGQPAVLVELAAQHRRRNPLCASQHRQGALEFLFRDGELAVVGHGVEQEARMHPLLGHRRHLLGDPVPVEMGLLDVDAAPRQVLGVLLHHPLDLAAHHALRQVDRMALAELVEEGLVARLAPRLVLLPAQPVGHRLSQHGRRSRRRGSPWRRRRRRAAADRAP